MTNGSNIKILMLEDNDADAEMVSQSLTRSGFPVVIHREEQRAGYLQALEQYTPDLIISDYNLPGYNGLRAFLDMREKGYSIPFILVTGSLTDEIAVDC